MKISVIGAGNVGASTALFLAQKKLGRIILIDMIEGMPAGKALDMAEAGPVARFDCPIQGTNNFDDMFDSDIVVITAGVPRKSGMTRMDLLRTNAEIVSSISLKVAELAPRALLFVVTNPLDVMAYVAWRTTTFPKERVIGMAGVLDSTRFRCFVADELKVSVEDTQAMVLGGHGDSMVPLSRYATVSGIPIVQLLPAERIERIVERTRKGGTEIVNFLKTGSAFYAPAASIAQMVESAATGSRRLLPASVYLEGEYDLHEVFAGVPVVIGPKGVEEIVEIELSHQEKEALMHSAADVRQGIHDWERLAKAKVRRRQLVET